MPASGERAPGDFGQGPGGPDRNENDVNWKTCSEQQSGGDFTEQ